MMRDFVKHQNGHAACKNIVSLFGFDVIWYFDDIVLSEILLIAANEHFLIASNERFLIYIHTLQVWTERSSKTP